MSEIIYLTEETFEEEALKSDIPVVIDFYADWCGPCKAIAPIMDEMADKYDGKAKICKVNIEEQKKLTISNSVMGVPTVFYVKDGEIVERVSGPHTQSEFEEKLDALI